MALQPWRPTSEFSSELQHQFDDLLERHFGHTALPHRYPASRTAPIEYYKEGDKLVVQVDVPGVDPKEIEVTLTGDVLKIAGEREDKRQEKERDFVMTEVSYGRFERTIRVPEGLKSDQITATYDKGILKLVMALPKAMEPQRVPVQAAAGSGEEGKVAKKPA